MFKNLGPVELLFIVIIILVLFGGKKIPEMMSGLGRGLNEFKRASKADPNDVTPEAPAPQPKA